MVERASGQRRLLHALTFSFVLMGAAIFAHDLVGGMVPSARVIAGSAAAAFGAGWWLAARRRPAVTVALAALVGQIGLHAIFALTMLGASGTHALSLVTCGRAPGSLRDQVMVAGSGSWDVGWMTAAHCAAAAIVLLSLRHVEDAAERLLGFVRSGWRLLLIVRCPSPSSRLPIARAIYHVRPRVAVALRSVISRRGPPARLAI